MTDTPQVNLETLLQTGHEALIKRLVGLVESGEASSQDRKLLWDILKDNDVILYDLSKDTLGDAEGAPTNLPFTPKLSDKEEDKLPEISEKFGG